MDLARTRQDIAKITVQVWKNYTNDGDDQRFQWDAERMALVLSE